MIYTVIVGVALSRPPKIDEYRKVLVVANGRYEAMLIAAQMSSNTSTMAVYTQIEDPK